jgi:hypothetical protein
LSTHGRGFSTHGKGCWYRFHAIAYVDAKLKVVIKDEQRGKHVLYAHGRQADVSYQLDLVDIFFGNT